MFILTITLSSCAAYNPIETNIGVLDNDLVNERLEIVEGYREKPAGFWKGLWHGIILPFAFIGKMFDGSIGIYETYNTGNWYNFGFLIGIIFWAGGSRQTSEK